MKKAISILLLLVILSFQLGTVLAADNTEIKQEYDTLDAYLKENFWIKVDDYYTITDDYDKLDKGEITELYIWSNSGTTLVIKDFTDLYDFSNLKTLKLRGLENIEKIDFTKLTNLREIEIQNCTLNGKIDLTNESLTEVRINLSCDLSNAVIDLRDRYERSYDYSIYFDVTNSENFSLINTLLVDNYFYTTIRENDISFWCLRGAGTPGAGINCDTLDNYLKNFYPNFSKEEITELVLDYNVWIEDLSSIKDLKNLRKLVMVENEMDGFSSVDISELKNLKEFSYEFELSEDIFDSYCPQLGTEIISNNYDEIKFDKIEESYTWTDTTFYDCRYYFNKYITNDNLKTEIMSGTDSTDIIKGFDVKNNGVTMQEILDSNSFAEDLKVKILDSNKTEVTDPNKFIGTGSVINLCEGDEIIKEYTVVIYGDTTGDGKITAVDALALIKHINNKILFASEAYSEAGRVRPTSGTNLSAVDALAIIKTVNGKNIINQNK